MEPSAEVSISCSQCVRRATPDCADCLVSFVLGETPEQLDMSLADVVVVDLFTREGLLPTLKFHRAKS